MKKRIRSDRRTNGVIFVNALRLVAISLAVVVYIWAPAAAAIRCKALHGAVLRVDNGAID